MGEQLTTFLQFWGTIDQFKSWLAESGNQEKIGSRIVWIHTTPQYNDPENPNHSEEGALFANGCFYKISQCNLTAEAIANLISNESTVKVTIKNDKLVIDAVTTENVTVAKAVGYLNANDTIPAGTTLQELVNMIFTKVLGLKSSATAPSVSITGITKDTKEVGELYSGTVTATFSDGRWNNEDDWANENSGNKTYQPYGCTAKSYSFSGMSCSASNNTATITQYPIVKGTNRVSVTVAYNASTNTPVNQNGVGLKEGTENSTTTFKPQVDSSTASVYTNTITGDYKYWIGYTAIPAANLTREDILDPEKFTIVTDGFTGTSISYLNEASSMPYNTPEGNYVTFIVPNTVSLQTVTDSFNNDVSDRFSETDKTGIGLKTTQSYRIYQEEAVASAGLDRKKITFK